MKRAFPLAALAHVLLLALLYLESSARQLDDGVTREHAARQRYEVLRREAFGERGLKPPDEEPERATDGPVPLPAGGAARAPLGRRRGLGAGWARGAAVAQSTDERTLLAELSVTPPAPGRVFVGQPAHARWSFVDSWYTIGPFPEGREAYPPELRVDLDAEYAGASGGPVRWRFLQSSRPEVVPETMTPYSVHYAYTKLRSDRERAAWLAFGADDRMKVWLNDELVWDCGEHWRPWALDEGTRHVTLRRGYNAVLVRLDNWPDHGAFSVAVRMLE